MEVICCLPVELPKNSSHICISVHIKYIQSIFYVYWNTDTYCWWKKSCTTWDVWNPTINGINYLSTGAGFLPSTVSIPRHTLEEPARIPPTVSDPASIGASFHRGSTWPRRVRSLGEEPGSALDRSLTSSRWFKPWPFHPPDRWRSRTLTIESWVTCHLTIPTKVTSRICPGLWMNGPLMSWGYL